MNDAKRGAWETYADSVNWQNKLGETIKLTGYQHFIRSNAAILAINGTLVTDGPEDLGLPAGDPLFAVSNCSEATQKFDCAFDDNMDWVTEDGGYLAMQQGVPQNPTRNFFAGPWRTCAFLSGIDPGGIASPSLALPNIGYTITEGQKIWWRAAIIRKDGRVSTKFECDPVIAVA